MVRKKSSEDTAAPDSPNGIYDSTYKGKTDSIYFYQQLKELQAEYEAYKETLDLRWSNPNRDQELEKANAKLVETQQKTISSDEPLTRYSYKGIPYRYG